PPFQQGRHRIAGDPGAQDGRVEAHRDLQRAVACLCRQSLHPRFVCGRQAMPQREIESLYKADDQDSQQTGADPSDPVLVYAVDHPAGGDGVYSDYAELDQREAPIIALIVVVARDPIIYIIDTRSDPGRAVVFVEVESQHISSLLNKLDSNPSRLRYC